METIKMQMKITGQGQLGYLVTVKTFFEKTKKKAHVLKIRKVGKSGTRLDKFLALVDFEEIMQITNSRKHAKIGKEYKAARANFLIGKVRDGEAMRRKMQEKINSINARMQLLFSVPFRKTIQKRLELR